MMKKLFFILTISFFLSPSAFCNDECSSVQINPKIKVLSSYGKLTFDKSKTQKELTKTTKQHVFVENGLFANGLSTANINFDISLKTYAQKLNDSKFCIIPKEVTIFLGFENPTIYISSNLEENSCEYNIVLNHEKTHQQINIKTLEYYLPLFKNTSTTIIKEIEPLVITDINKLEDTTNDYIKIYNKKLTPLVDFIKKEIFEQQKKLDNPDNYKYENSLCD